MPFKTVKVETYRVTYECHSCGKEMKPTRVITTLPPIYYHCCHSCDIEIALDDSYPKIITKEIEDK